MISYMSEIVTLALLICVTVCVLCSVRTQRVRPSYMGIDWLRPAGWCGLVADMLGVARVHPDPNRWKDRRDQGAVVRDGRSVSQVVYTAGTGLGETNKPKDDDV